MRIDANTILTVKYIVAAMVLVLIILAPAYLAAQTKKAKADAMRVRVASWLFGWTGVGWLLALIWAIRK
ncbi:MAG: superinfection immunity protein [Alphaproteobacteria bacterium]|nr:superinfection immunity protein [Alphaproteobacteria bacterium]